MKQSLTTWLRDVLTVAIAYVGARWIWAQEDPFKNLPLELLTFAVLYVLFQVLIRGRKLARKGK